MNNAPENGLPPAGWYGDPQEPGLERWWNGVAWSEHGRAKDAAAHSASVQPTASKSLRVCPTCGAEDVKTLKMIHDQGTSTGSATTTGWVQGTGNQSGLFGTFSTATKNYTEAAREAAAPRKRFNGVVLIVIGVVLAGVLSSIGYALGTDGAFGTPTLNIAIAVVVGLVIMIIGVSLAMRDSAYNRDVYPDAHARWTRSWQCQRCGTVFLV